MSQKSILSFFKSSDKSNEKETKSKVVIVNDSPVKKTKSKRKVQCLESDEESSNSPVKNLNIKSKCIKTTVDSEDKVKKSGGEIDVPSDINSEQVEKDVDVKRNGDFSPRKSKQRKMENGEQTASHPRMVESDTAHKNGELIEKKDTIIDSSTKPEEASSSNQIDFINFIPKRKTARKQMNSSASVKYIAEMKDNLKSKTDCETVSEKTSFNEQEQKSEQKIEENVPSSENREAEKDLKVQENTSSKTKGSPLKKSSKKESINNFFTPVKRTSDKDSIEETSEIKKCSSMEIDNDSPVKKVKKAKKKIKALESDDEDDDESVRKEATVKNETDSTEIANCDSSLPQQDNNVEKSENSISDAHKTSSDKQATDNSKTKCEKKTFGVKSTTAVDTSYDPSKHNYHPVDDAFWKLNEKVPYLALAKTLEIIENTSGRLKTIEILSNYLRSVIVLSPDDLLHSIYLCLNRVAPEYEGIELGVGETLLMKAVAQATGRTLEKIKAEVAIKGDLGLVSESSRVNQRVMFAPPKLTVSSVFNKFLEIAKMSGNAAMAKKTDKIKSLFVACRDCEAKYIIRSLSGKLRIGLAEQSILCAIARAAVQTPPGQEYPPKIVDTSKGKSTDSFKEFLDSQTLLLKTAYCECPNYDLIVPVLLKYGISALPDHCQLSPGVPLKPMLAHPTAGIDKVLERFDKNAFTCEFKYDGERAQIHMNDEGIVRIFSRNQEDNTSKYPDVISRISNALKKSTKSFILDSEAVAWDMETKQILPFQVLSTRKRKDAKESEIVVQVCIMAFDLLYLNGESLVKKPLKERRSLLHSSFIEVENEIMFAKFKDGNSAETMQEFLEDSMKGNCEGLMVKSLEVDASYEIAKRSRNWLKLKKDYLQGVGDTLDLVVIGGYYGKGKRTGNYGGFLLACYDDENEEFQSICKLGTGFKDDILEAHSTFLKKHVIEEPKSYFRYDHSLEPDDWFEPVQVWEIKCADLSISPVHKAATGIVDSEKGISLRFPRFIRIRDDKTPENATNSVQIAEMYQQQQQIQNTANKTAKVEEDYY